MSDLPDDLESSPIVKTSEWVAKRIEDAVQHGMFVEILVWALIAMKSDPTMEIEQAVKEACYEWDV